jgi:hypothetical protein
MLHSYNQKPVAPAYLMEGHYDLENVGDPPDFGTPLLLRKQNYWTMLTGGMGQFYGNKYTWSFADGWKNQIDTPGVGQLGIWKTFFSSVPWQDLVPDQDHSVLTGGYGTYGDVDTRVSESDYGTAARTPDGSLVVVYMPTARAVTLNMASLQGAAKARWFDPASGSYQETANGPVPNSGSHEFSPPARIAPVMAIGFCCFKRPLDKEADTSQKTRPATSLLRPDQDLHVPVLLVQQPVISLAD